MTGTESWSWERILHVPRPPAAQYSPVVSVHAEKLLTPLPGPRAAPSLLKGAHCSLKLAGTPSQEGSPGTFCSQGSPESPGRVGKPRSGSCPGLGLLGGTQFSGGHSSALTSSQRFLHFIYLFIFVCGSKSESLS